MLESTGRGQYGGPRRTSQYGESWRMKSRVNLGQTMKEEAIRAIAVARRRRRDAVRALKIESEWRARQASMPGAHNRSYSGGCDAVRLRRLYRAKRGEVRNVSEQIDANKSCRTDQRAQGRPLGVDGFACARSRTATPKPRGPRSSQALSRMRERRRPRRLKFTLLR